MKLLEFKDYRLNVSDEAFLVKPIRKIFNSDRSVNKENFFKQMSYLYFMMDPRSDYSYIIDEDERALAIIEQEGLEPKFKPSKELQEAMEIYKKLTTTTSTMLLQDTRIAVDKVRQFLRDVDLNAVDQKTGRPIYTVSSVTTAIKQIPQLAKDLMETEKLVAKEIEEQGRARGGNEKKKLFEDFNI